MKRNLLGTLGALAMLVCVVGCSGVRDSGNAFVAHGECFRIIGFPIPEDDMKGALDKVPANGTITNINASAADWTSFWGALGNILGFHGTQIGGTK